VHCSSDAASLIFAQSISSRMQSALKVVPLVVLLVYRFDSRSVAVPVPSSQFPVLSSQFETLSQRPRPVSSSISCPLLVSCNMLLRLRPLPGFILSSAGRVLFKG